MCVMVQESQSKCQAEFFITNVRPIILYGSKLPIKLREETWFVEHPPIIPVQQGERTHPGARKLLMGHCGTGRAIAILESIAVQNIWTEFCNNLYNFQLRTDINIFQVNQTTAKEPADLSERRKSPGIDKIPGELLEQDG